MATRYYLSSTDGTVGITPAVSSIWSQTDAGTFARRKMSATKDSSALTEIASSGSSSAHTEVHRQFISAPIGAQTITGTISIVLSCREDDATRNHFLALTLRVIGPDATVRGTLYTNTAADTEFFASTTPGDLRTRIVNAAAVTSVAALNGDYLVLEIGSDYPAGSALDDWAIEYGSSSGTDLALTSGVNANNNPWMELSHNITDVSAGSNQLMMMGVGT